jgi:hypothetical protein
MLQTLMKPAALPDLSRRLRGGGNLQVDRLSLPMSHRLVHAPISVSRINELLLDIDGQS